MVNFSIEKTVNTKAARILAFSFSGLHKLRKDENMRVGVSVTGRDSTCPDVSSVILAPTWLCASGSASSSCQAI